MSKKKFKEHKQKKQKEEGKTLRQAVLSFFNESPGISFSFKQLARQLGPKNKIVNKKLFAVIEELEESGKIRLLADDSYMSTRKSETAEGVVDHVNPRFAYINTGGESDVYVRTSDLGTALHGHCKSILDQQTNR